MPYSRPTLTTLRQQAMQDISISAIGTNGFLPRSVLGVLAWLVAGFAWLHYGYIDWVAKESVPFTATDEYLEAWANLKGVFRKDATAAVLTVQFTGTDGVDLPAVAEIIRGDGVAYTNTADVVVSGGVVSGNFTCSTPGTIGNSPVGSPLALSSPITGINAQGIVTGVATTGTDQELDPDLRTRMLQRYANPPQSGDRADYVGWALEVPGVTRAWVNPNGAGVGTVVVYTMWDEAEAAYGGFPQGADGVASAESRSAPAAGDQLTVANHIDPVRPVTALVYSVAPINAPQDFTITSLSPNTTTVQSGIRSALTDMFLRLGNVGGTINPEAGDAWPAIFPSDWNEAIASVPGIGHFDVTSPVDPITVTTGRLPTLGTTTFSN